MHNRRLQLLILGIIGTVSLLLQPLLTAQPAPAVADWTLLVFMNGDNNLEPDA